MEATLFSPCTLLLFAALAAAAQEEHRPACAPGPEAQFQDDLLDELVGDWTLTGNMMGRELAQQCSARWVLNHKFVRLDCRETRNPPLLKVRYESTMYVGCSSASHRYVVNLVDIFGAGDSLGFGRRTGDTIRFVWEQPDGTAFENEFAWKAGSHTWVSSLRQRDRSGKWTSWGEKTLRPRK